MLASSVLLASILGSVSAATARLEDRDFLLDPSLLLPGRSTCSLLAGINPLTPTSCTNTTVQNDLCCFNAPGGHFLQTQFWDYESPLKWAGPNDSWTVHGLWPDHCDGTYDQYCSSAREVKNITQILQAKGENSLLEWMGEYWKDNTGNDESFWEHEFNKHATCISTLDPKCIRNYQSGDDVVIFIKRTISLFQLLPTHFFLAARGIVPSTARQYKLADIQQAIVSATGKKPTIGCDGPGKTFLHEMWYHYLTRGSVIDGVFLHADADSSNSCADTVWYWPKGVPTPSSTPTSTSSSAASSTPTSTVDKGTIQVYTSNGTNVGCVLSKGTWSQQTCATFRPSAGSTIGTFTYTSSKGLCAIDATNGTLACSADIKTGSEFTNSTISTGSLLAYDASTSFSADVVPTGTVQSTIYSGDDHAQGITLVYVRA